ncbi:energy transducer TonB [Planktothrix pseudagardhii]|uniref:TonB C-terminal domain-containing protein n=1 Tax=Planktothrix pseudagardhii TaxID=132604 RepID=A0A9W4CU73_9CYAN|nr:energy transducer TonB [Planktothrix pseudagardhii]CAD5973334.1 hypothetical protein NO713_03981 [Planktothrix pseudagardhii]
MTASTTSLTEFFPPTFRPPVVLCVLASLGVHGLFAANIQYINFYSKSIKLPPTVQVVELSPEQISRVYPAPPPKLSFTPLNSLSSSLSVLPVPSTDNIVPPPAPEDFMQASSLPVWPTNIPLPPPSNSPSLPSYRLPPVVSQGSNSNSNDLNSGSIGFLPNSNPSLSFVPGPPLGFDNSNSSPPPGQSGQLKQPGSLPPNDELALRQQLIRDLGQDVDCPPMFNNANCGPKTPNQNDNPTNTPPPENNPNVQPSHPKGSILAGLEKGLQQQPSTSNPQPPEGVVNEQQTAMLQGGSAYLNWVNGLLTNYPNLETTSPIGVNNLYPNAACEQKLTGKALIGVAVGETGEILQGPEVLLATGYPVLDDAAKAAVQEMTFDPTNSPKAYQIQFQFNSEENCKTVNNPTPQPDNTPAVSSPPPAQPTPPTSETEQPVNPVEQKPPESDQPNPEQSPSPQPQPESNP